MIELLQRFNRPIVAILAVTALAGGLRLYHLSRPAERVFDEHFYTKDGCLYAGYPPTECAIHGDTEKYWVDTWGESSWEHPQLGKWTIALGIKAFGNTPFGWRISSVVFGTATVTLVAVLAQLLFGSALWTFVAGLLLGTESLNFVQSRTSMLDIFLTFWILLGFVFLVLDRRWIERRMPRSTPERVPAEEPVVVPAAERIATATAIEPEASPGPSYAAPPTPEPVPSPIFRPWRLAVGIALGCAVATKWSGVNAIFAAGILSIIWERTRRRGRTPHPLWQAIQQEAFGLVVFLVLVPIVAYVVAYARFFVMYGLDFPKFWGLQEAMASFHFHLQGIDPTTHKPIHPYLSPAWKWILIGRPVVYYFASPGTEITGIGNPAIFWGSLFALPFVALAWWRKRDWRAGFVAIGGLGQYLPWFLVSRPLFFFYVLPITPFFVLAVTYTVRELATAHLAGSRARPYLPVAVSYILVCVVTFAFFYPVLTASPLSESAWHLRQWFTSWI
jgi:dolichyl-phosphate-mannose-protein mannosyltransferase